MSYAGEFRIDGEGQSTQYIQNDLSLCCSRHGAQRDLAHFALSNWHDDEQKRLLKAAYNEVLSSRAWMTSGVN